MIVTINYCLEVLTQYCILLFYVFITLNLFHGMLSSALKANEVSAGICIRKFPAVCLSSSNTSVLSSLLHARNLCANWVQQSPALIARRTLASECDRLRTVLGAAFLVGFCACFTRTKVIGCGKLCELHVWESSMYVLYLLFLLSSAEGRFLLGYLTWSA